MQASKFVFLLKRKEQKISFTEIIWLFSPLFTETWLW